MTAGHLKVKSQWLLCGQPVLTFENSTFCHRAYLSDLSVFCGS
jgi:hypothetical protein